MKKFSCKLIIFAVFITLSSLFLIPVSYSQDAGASGSDSSNLTQPIDLSTISKESAEITKKAKRMVGRVIKDKNITALKHRNDSLTNYYDSLVSLESEVRYSFLSKRILENKLIMWEQRLDVLSQEDENLTSIFTRINENSSPLKEEMEAWNNKVDNAISGEKSARVIKKQMKELEQMIDTTLTSLDEKAAKVYTLLNDVSKMEVEIEAIIEKISQEITVKNESKLISDQASLFAIDYTNSKNWGISKATMRYYKNDLKNIENYLGNNIVAVIIHIILIIVLISLLMKTSKIQVKGGNKEGGVYKKRLKLILSRPVSSGLVVGLFASVIIYSNQPLIFNDFLRMAVTIPIVLILIKILPRKFRIYPLVFGALIFLQIIYINLPLQNIFARLLLLSIAIIELSFLAYFTASSRNEIKRKGKSTGFILYTCYVLTVFSLIGLIGNVVGKVMLSEFMVEAVISLTLIAIIISLSTIVVNGLIVSLIDSKYGDKLNVIKKYRTLSKQKITTLVNFSAIIIVIYYLLIIFDLQTYFANGINDFFYTERNIGSVSFTWVNIFIFFLVIWLSTVLGDLIRIVLEDDVLSRMSLKKGLPHTIALLIKYSLVTLGVVLGVSAAGLPMNSLTVLIGALGVGIGFGLQNIFNNLVSGLILLFERPIQIGDTIEFGTLMGKVQSIGIRSSNIRTFDGAEIIVPNGNLISNEVTNWTLSDDHRRIEIIAGVSYSSDPNQVKEILMKVISSHPEVSRDPEPNVLFKEMADSSLNFRLLFWTRNFNQWIQIKSEVVFGVFYALKEAGIEIPFPQRDLHVRSVDPTVNLNPQKNQTKEIDK